MVENSTPGPILDVHTEWKSGRYERAVKHYLIAAKMGDDGSLKNLKEIYGTG